MIDFWVILAVAFSLAATGPGELASAENAPTVPFISITSASADRVQVLFRSSSSGEDRIVLADCKPPVVNPVADCKDYGDQSQTPRNYDLILRNQLRIDSLLPAFTRTQYLQAQIERLQGRITSKDTPPETAKRLQEKSDALQKEITQLTGVGGTNLKAQQPNFDLYRRIIANLGIESLQFPTTAEPKGWNIDQEDQLSDYGISTIANEPLSRLLKQPIRVQTGARAQSSGGFIRATGREGLAVSIPSAYDLGKIAALKISLSPPDQDPLVYQGLFSYFDEKGNLIFQQPLSPDFHNSVTPKAMIEIGPYHYLFVGQDGNGFGLIGHLWWQPGGVVNQQYYTLDGLPHAQSVVMTPDHKVLVTALGKDSVWIAQLNAALTGIDRKLQVFTNPLGDKTTVLDGFSLGTSDGRVVVVALGNPTTEAIGATTTCLARTISLSADWKTVVWDRPVSPASPQRILDGTWLPDGKVALVGFSQSSLIPQYADSQEPKTARTWLEIVDAKGKDDSVFELDKNYYADNTSLSMVDYNPVSKEIAVGMESAYEGLQPETYFFDQDGVLKTIRRLGDENFYGGPSHYDIRSVTHLPGREGFLFGATATENQEVPNPDYGPYGDLLDRPETINQEILGQVFVQVTASAPSSTLVSK